MIVPVLFFSLSGSKLPGYVLPALPGALVLLTEKIWRTGELRRSWRAGIVITAAAVFFVTSILLVRTVPDFAAGDSVKALIGIADGKGNSTQNVLGFHTVSHNAEFYAAGRLVRSVDGKQRKFISAAELAAEIRRESSGRALVLSPLNWVPALDSNEIDYEILADNGDLAIVEVWLR
jgi:4-amino-4-deoxy-L-arabinose transferase-like glycosyltransferase